MQRSFLIVPAVMTAIFMAAPPVHAHSLGADCKVVKTQVEVEAFFSDDTPARNAKVTIENAANSAVRTGTTDDYGKCSLSLPDPGDYRVIVDAGDGHRVVRPLIITSSNTDLPEAFSEPTRAEFTRTPWIGMTAGLFLIAVVALAARWLIRKPVRTSSAS